MTTPQQDAEPRTFEQIFYTLPVEQVAQGMSTDDGWDILDIKPSVLDPTFYHAECYESAPDDAEQDAANREISGGRTYRSGERVDLAVFSHTETDGSALPDAVITRTELFTFPESE